MIDPLFVDLIKKGDDLDRVKMCVVWILGLRKTDFSLISRPRFLSSYRAYAP